MKNKFFKYTKDISDISSYEILLMLEQHKKLYKSVSY